MKSANEPGVSSGLSVYLNDVNEIRIEILSKDSPALVRFTTRYPDSLGQPAQFTQEMPLGFDPSAGYHEYGFNWYPDKIEFFVDAMGVPFYTLASAPAIPQNPGYITVNCWSRGDAGWEGGLPTSTTSMYVDWVSYWGRTASVIGSAYSYPETPTYRATFSMDVKAPLSVDGSPSGSLKYYYSRTRMNFASTVITGMSVTNNTVTISGNGTVNGVGGYKFVAFVTDGSPDQFGITINKPDGSLFYRTNPSLNSIDTSGGDLLIQ
jgi:hypothetical protein